MADPAAAARSNREREPKRDDSVLSRPAGVPLMAIVSLGEQRVTIYDAEGRILRAPVSTGQTGYETPAGIYSVIQKEAEHYSNLYDDASMPFMQRITWSGIALHAGALPGHPASHGCIRMPHGFAERLFELTAMGMRVIVVPDRRDARRHRPSGPVQAAAARRRGVACGPARIATGQDQPMRLGAGARRQRAAAHHSAAAPRDLEVDRRRQGGRGGSRSQEGGRGQVGRRKAGDGVGAPRQGPAPGGGRQEPGRGACSRAPRRRSRPPTPTPIPTRPQSSAPRRPRPRRRPRSPKPRRSSTPPRPPPSRRWRL